MRRALPLLLLFAAAPAAAQSYPEKATTIFRRFYTTFPDWAPPLLDEIDNPHAFAAFTKLADDYALLYDWQISWAGEVHTPREAAAYVKVVSRHHTEQEEADAALLDGYKKGAKEKRRREAIEEQNRVFSSSARSALSSLPYACRRRLDAATVTILDEPAPGLPLSTVAKFTPAPGAAADPSDACAPGSGGTLALFRGPVYRARPEDLRTELRSRILAEVGCRDLLAARPRESLLAPDETLRDAVGSGSPSKRRAPPVRVASAAGPAKPKACKVRAPTPPVIAEARASRSVKTAGEPGKPEDLDRSNGPSEPGTAPAKTP